MKNQSGKKRGGDDEDGSVISIDRLSELPQPILHHLLCLLSQKEAIQTCVLSKSWRHLGSTRPKLDFYAQDFPRNTEKFQHAVAELSHAVAQKHLSFLLEIRDTFVPTVEKTLQRYHDQNLCIQDFLFEAYPFPDSISVLQKWIPFVLANIKNLKTLNLNLYWTTSFTLPSAVFQAESLEELHLVGCELSQIGSTEKVLFKRLKTLSLESVDIEREAFEKIMCSCPLLQCLVLKECLDLANINIVNILDKAQNITISHFLEINWYHHHHHNNCFPRLKSLHIGFVDLCTKSLDIFSSDNFPCLEELELYHCNGLEEIKISSHSIKRLSIFMPPSCRMTKAAAIDAPNILCFKLSVHEDDVPSPFSFTKTSSREWKSGLSVCCPFLNRYPISTWFLNLYEMLKALCRSQISVDFNYQFERDIFAQIESGFDKPVVVEHLSLRRYFPNLLNCLFRICRPRYIQKTGTFCYDCPRYEQVQHYSMSFCEFRICGPRDTDEIGKFCYDSPRDAQQDLESFCKFLINERKECYFWQQDLEELSIQLWDKNGVDRWHPIVEGTNLPKYTSVEEKFWFRLKWRDY